jgi:hypothetical protein
VNSTILTCLEEPTWPCCKKTFIHITWKRALIEHLIKGRDGKISTAIFRTPEGKITRPIQLVIPLEVDQVGEDVEECLSS